MYSLTLSWRRPLSYRNQSIDLLHKSMYWFLYDNDLRHDRVKESCSYKFRQSTQEDTCDGVSYSPQDSSTVFFLWTLQNSWEQLSLRNTSAGWFCWYFAAIFCFILFLWNYRIHSHTLFWRKRFSVDQNFLLSISNNLGF